MVGETLSHFRILERVGRGGMGEVWKAEDTLLRRFVALKMLPEECTATEAAHARLLSEARAVSALVHPNIAVVYEVGDLGDAQHRRSFIAMEYVPGETLAERVARGPLPAADVVAVLRQAADALAAAHDAGVVHRDVKPGNIVLSASGRVKVLDFGLAKVLANDTAATWTADGTTRSVPGEVVGTVSYMSPEQSLGRALDARTDVFSLGVVAYELLSGHRPFEGASAREVLDAIRHAAPPALVEAPPALERLVSWMLEKEPERRPASMREVMAAIQAIAALDGAEYEAPAREESVAVLPFANITRSAEDDWLGTGIAETLVADLRRIPGVAVVPRERIAEAARRAPEGEEALALGRALGARWIVTGAYQRAGDAVRATASLTDVASGALSRSVKADGPMSEIFALQDRIAAELSEGFAPTGAPRPADETPVVAAYEAYTKGLVNLRTESRDSLDRAILFFQRAIALDPAYARAHQALGTAWDLKASFLVVPELFERALAEYRRAIELRPDFVFAWKELAGALLSLERDDEALEAVGRALRLDPKDPGAHGMHARILFIGLGRFRESAAEYERALTLNPEAGWYALQLAHVAALLGDFPRAEAAARRAIALQEEFLSGREGVLSVGAYVRLGQIEALKGRYREAVEEYRREEAYLVRVDHALGDRTRIELGARMGSALVRAGEGAAGREALAAAAAAFDTRVALGADEPFSRYYATCALAMLGENERALESLARTAARRRAFTAERARIEPDFEELRLDPRFEAALGT